MSYPPAPMSTGPIVMASDRLRAHPFTMSMKEKLLRSDLDTLRHGGQDAIALFLKTSRCLHHDSTGNGLKDWIAVAAPALPEAERGEILLMLMSAYLLADCGLAQHLSRAGDPPKTIH